MAVLDRLRGSQDAVGPQKLDRPLQITLEKGRARHRVWKPYWAEPLAFIEGRQFVFRSKVSGAVSLNELDTTEGGAKPQYRSRLIDNRVLGYWASEVSAATQRVPQYEVTPTSPDPEVRNAASLGEKVLQYLYQFLDMRAHVVEAYGYAVACGEGFIWPYWNAYAGSPLPPDPQNPDESLYEGELCLESLGPHEVFWAAGMRFYDSPYHAIERAQTLQEVRKLPGYLGGELRPDAQGNQNFISGQLAKANANGDMVLVTDYLERPTPQNPRGRRLRIANNQVICAPEPYPIQIKGPKGYEPCIHKVSYFPTPWRDRDMGLVEHLVDPQRTKNDAMNKAVEHKNLALAPRLLAQKGSLKRRITTEPGSVIEYEGNTAPIALPQPPVPDSLFQMQDKAVEAMEEISSQRSIPTQVDSGKALQAFIERDQTRRAYIVQSLADFHSRLGRHLLIWVQQNYTEDRLLVIEGRHGADYIPDFRGADLKGQTQVRVLPGSIEPRTRAAIEQKIMNLAQLGWIDKEQGLAAIEDGSADDLVEDYELNVQKQYREIQQMIAMVGPDGQPLPGAAVPFAREFDNHPLHRQILHRWMLTKEFEESPQPVQEAANLHDQQHAMLEQQQAQQAAMAQSQQAAQLGMQNATSPPPAKPMPSLPAAQ